MKGASPALWIGLVPMPDVADGDEKGNGQGGLRSGGLSHSGCSCANDVTCTISLVQEQGSSLAEADPWPSLPRRLSLDLSQ